MVVRSPIRILEAISAAHGITLLLMLTPVHHWNVRLNTKLATRNIPPAQSLEKDLATGVLTIRNRRSLLSYH